MNKPLPDRPLDEGETYGSSDFHEVLDPQVLKAKSVIVNRAPIMTAWAMVVAERIGFQREEALSIGMRLMSFQSMLQFPTFFFHLSFVECSLGLHRYECHLQRRVIRDLRTRQGQKYGNESQRRTTICRSHGPSVSSMFHPPQRSTSQ
jgi:hypothetical protein